MSIGKKILLLTLVHPDFLPPVYAAAKVLRDEGYFVDIVTFESLVPTSYSAGENIVVTTAGNYNNQPFFKRLALRKSFYSISRSKLSADTAMIISFCPFSFLCAQKVRGTVPHAYLALEVNNIWAEPLLSSPLNNLRAWKTFKQLHAASIVATPSIQRSAWLAGVSKLQVMPFTIQNASYFEKHIYNDAHQHLDDLLPATFRDKVLCVYTGRLNENYRIIELLQAFDKLDDDEVVLAVTGLKENDDYCRRLIEVYDGLKQKERVALLPIVPRHQMVALQQVAHIGVCFLHESDELFETRMAAPNKVGEYIANGLYTLGNQIEYMIQFQSAGVATLVKGTTEEDIYTGLLDALHKVRMPETKQNIERFFQEQFCMQKQMAPVLEYLNNAQRQ